MGLSQLAAKEYNLDRGDLIQLATIESEFRKITKAKQGEPDGEGR
jgi:hypothetical protein